MNAKTLIELAARKGLNIGRNRSNEYHYGYSDGTNYHSHTFYGTWNEFVKFVQDYGTMNTYTLEHKLCDAKPGSCVPEAIWSASFAFHAKDETDGLRKAHGWARYHSFDVRDVRIRLATEHEAEHWLHNEWVS